MKLLIVLIAMGVIGVIGSIENVYAEYDITRQVRINNCSSFTIFGNADFYGMVNMYLKFKEYFPEHDLYGTYFTIHERLLTNDDGSYEVTYTIPLDHNITDYWWDGDSNGRHSDYGYINGEWRERENYPKNIKLDFVSEGKISLSLFGLDYYVESSSEHDDKLYGRSIQKLIWEDTDIVFVRKNVETDERCFYLKEQVQPLEPKTRIQLAVEDIETKLDKKTDTKNKWKERHSICFDKKENLKSTVETITTELNQCKLDIVDNENQCTQLLTDHESQITTLESNYNLLQQNLTNAEFTIEKLKQEKADLIKKIEQLEG